MGIHDRPYWKEQPAGGGGGYGGGGGQMRLAFPRPTSAVKVLLIVNIVVFVLQLFADRPTVRHPAGVMTQWLGISVGTFWQVWRYLTFQFLHADFWHIVLNMLGLYLLGAPLEQTWGPRRFVVFYLACGAVAGAAYVVIGAMFHEPAWRPLIGASGGVYAIVLAAAVLFPHFRLIFFLFPVPIRLAALIIFGGMIVLVLQSVSYGHMSAAMSDVAHLGGAVAAAAYIWLLPRLRGWGSGARTRVKAGAWQKKMQQRAADEAELDRILEKIRREGLDSLSPREKRTLREATERQRRGEL